ncbi:hypothetical protein TARUN_2352 [Trichoderma arundinaceum]|uniref:Uncharacterized protein n=1 Tax=Trichoderma arundinaceum TaxID=490622 RepID=A0A395NV47_TRIAR|nr:hypothetical protein TARUN_2352 [Trichoderma arundinaceum]
MADPGIVAVVAGVLGIIATFWGIDKATGEGWKMWKRRFNKLKKLVISQDAAAEMLKKTIKDGLGQWINEDVYNAYLGTKIQRIVAERDRIALLTTSGGIDRRISAAETQIDDLEQLRIDIEATWDHDLEKMMNEQGISEEGAKKKVEEDISEVVDQTKGAQQEKAKSEADKKRARDGVDAFTKDIDEKKKLEETQKEEI